MTPTQKLIAEAIKKRTYKTDIGICISPRVLKEIADIYEKEDKGKFVCPNCNYKRTGKTREKDGKVVGLLCKSCGKTCKLISKPFNRTQFLKTAGAEE